MFSLTLGRWSPASKALDLRDLPLAPVLGRGAVYCTWIPSCLATVAFSFVGWWCSSHHIFTLWILLICGPWSRSSSSFSASVQGWAPGAVEGILGGKLPAAVSAALLPGLSSLAWGCGNPGLGMKPTGFCENYYLLSCRRFWMGTPLLVSASCFWSVFFPLWLELHLHWALKLPSQQLWGGLGV